MAPRRTTRSTASCQASRTGHDAGMEPAKPIVLYDGTCGLCHKSVKWILRHEADHDIQFAPLQGPTAADLRTKHPEIPQNVDTVVLVEGGRARLRSKAFMYVSPHLPPP